MKFMEIINKLQAALTELRGAIQREYVGKKYRGPKHEAIPPMQMDYGGMAGYSPAIDPHRCFVCGIPADMGIGNALGAQIGYCRKHMPQRATGTAGECPCHHSLLDCPLCRPRMDKYYQGVMDKCYKEEWEKQHPPDLPLHVRVAKALGLNPFFDYVGWCSLEKARKENLGAWCYATKKHKSNLVPDYPNDLVAAMGALEEYVEKKQKIVTIKRNRAESYYVTIYPPTVITHWNKSLPQAICEAIVAHAEAK